MSTLKKRVISLETRLEHEATLEDLLRVIRNEQKGVKVPEKEWERIRGSRVYKYIESCACINKL